MKPLTVTPPGSSAAALSMEAARQRVRTLEAENRRLMSSQGQLVADANRRVEMHLNEIRVLREEAKSLRAANAQLQEICAFLDEDRQKNRQLSREWQKFGRYTSDLMKQEVTAYQQRLSEQSERHSQLMQENEELKRLCLYLDEQRQAVISQATAMAEEAAGVQTYYRQTDGDSSDAGCGSSAQSSDCEREDIEKIGQPMGMHEIEFDDEQENAVRALTASMRAGVSNEANLETSEAAAIQDGHKDRLFNYIHSLENRIKTLEHQTSLATSNNSLPRRFSTELMSPRPTESKTAAETPKGKSAIQILSHIPAEELPSRSGTPTGTSFSRQGLCSRMMESTTSTMTSSGTTFCSSDTDESAATAVFVMGDDSHDFAALSGHLEVRALGPIDEESEADATVIENVGGGSHQNSPTSGLLTISKRISSSSEHSTTGSASTSTGDESGIECGDLPPQMPLITGDTSSARLSLCSSNQSLDNCSHSSSSKSQKSLPENFSTLGRTKPPPSYNQVKLRHRASFNAAPITPVAGLRPQVVGHSTLAEAVNALQHGDPNPPQQRRTCQNGWTSLERRKVPPPQEMNAQITAV
uniref:Coiled-coil domain-containing protein 85A n=1 Tax=Panagrellus redivivus TaxID=6233 RepID=A0A7E4W1H6_PANRE